MTSYISADLRRIVKDRARGMCEYRLIHERDTFLGCQVDHIISEKHGGPTDEENTAFACTCCNRAKGSDIGSINMTTGSFIRLFNPRKDRWRDHFALQGVSIVPLTPIGEATSRLLDFNVYERLAERSELQEHGRYPPSEASGVA